MKSQPAMVQTHQMQKEIENEDEKELTSQGLTGIIYRRRSWREAGLGRATTAFIVGWRHIISNCLAGDSRS